MRISDWSSDVCSSDLNEFVDFEETLAYEYVSLYESSAICVFLKKHAHSLNKSLNVRIQTASFDAVCCMVETDIGVSVLLIRSEERRVEQECVSTCRSGRAM